MRRKFYNTIELKGIDLEKANFQAQTQNERVIELFRNVTKKELTPFQVLKLYTIVYNTDPPVTSIRRALTTLTAAGRLEKTANTKKERYGQPNYYWRLNEC